MSTYLNGRKSFESILLFDSLQLSFWERQAPLLQTFVRRLWLCEDISPGYSRSEAHPVQLHSLGSLVQQSQPTTLPGGSEPLSSQHKATNCQYQIVQQLLCRLTKELPLGLIPATDAVVTKAPAVS